MVSKGQGKRIGWGQWKVAQDLGVKEEWGKYGSLNLLYDGNRFLKYRKGSITQFRNQGVVFQFACKNRKKYGCRAVIERIEFTNGQPKMYRISNNIHCEECRKRTFPSNQNVGKSGNDVSHLRPSPRLVSQSNVQMNVNHPPPPSVVKNINNGNFGRPPQRPPKRPPKRRMDQVSTKEMRRRMFHLRKEYNMLYEEYKKRKSQVMNTQKKEWYEIPVPPATNSSKKNLQSFFSSPSKNQDIYQPNSCVRAAPRNMNYEQQHLNHETEENRGNVDFCESSDHHQVANNGNINVLPKIETVLYPELRSASNAKIERPEGDWDFYSGFAAGDQKRYLLN